MAAGVSDADFQLVNLHHYRSILLKMIDQFTTLEPSGLNALWWWNSFKDPKYSWPDCLPMCAPVLRQLVPADETIWFVAEDWGRQKKHGNFWLYESRIGAITAILDEAWHFEFYLVSKKFAWLLCQNHHDVLMAVGEPMVSKLKRMTETS